MKTKKASNTSSYGLFGGVTSSFLREIVDDIDDPLICRKVLQAVYSISQHHARRIIKSYSQHTPRPSALMGHSAHPRAGVDDFSLDRIQKEIMRESHNAADLLLWQVPRLCVVRQYYTRLWNLMERHSHASPLGFSQKSIDCVSNMSITEYSSLSNELTKARTKKEWETNPILSVWK